MSLASVQSDLEHRLGATRHFRSVQAVKRPEDWRNEKAVGIIDRIIATIPDMPADLVARYDTAWPDGDPEAMNRFDDVMEEAGHRLGFGASPANAADFVSGFLAKLTPPGAPDEAAEDEDRETAFLAAHATAFTMYGHLRGPNRISGLSDEDARRRLDEARATMARLQPEGASS